LTAHASGATGHGCRRVGAARTSACQNHGNPECCSAKNRSHVYCPYQKRHAAPKLASGETVGRQFGLAEHGDVVFWVHPTMSLPSDLQQAMDRCFGADAVTRATNANGRLTSWQRAKESLLSGGYLLGLTGGIALFGWLVMSAPANLGVRTVFLILILAGCTLFWKSVKWLRDALRGHVMVVQGEPDLRSDVNFKGPSYYYARVGPTELRVPSAAWRVLCEHKRLRWRFCYLPRMRRAVSIEILT
jgi:hypothetical protein